MGQYDVKVRSGSVASLDGAGSVVQNRDLIARMAPDRPHHLQSSERAPMKRLRYVSGALLAVLWTAPLYAQGPGGVIRGRVMDGATQQPLSGVTVTFGRRGALSLPDGRYTIAGVPASTDTLRARLLGYSPAVQVVTVGAGDTITADLALTAQAISLSEVVVVGYGEQTAGNITGAVTQLSSAEFNTGRVISPEQLIQSKVAGVQVVDNNEPGGGLTIRIRGATSVNASSDPLYVVDGMPVGIASGAGGGLSAGRNPLNFLNPNDIETITVLRDASAAAIYGANAANGVVLIQTKAGRGRPEFEYTTSFSTSSITRRPDMLNADQFRAAVQQYAPQNVGQLQNANTDWFDLVTQSGFGQEHNLSVSGSGESMNWRLSGGYLNQEGIIRGTNVERFSLGLNLHQRLFDDRLDVRANVRGSRTDDEFTPGGVLSNAAQMGPTQGLYSESTPTGYYEWPGPDSLFKTLQSPDNPLAILDRASDRGTTYRSIGNLQAQYRLPFLEALRANVNLGYDVARTDRQIFLPSTLHGELKSGRNGWERRANQGQTNTTLESYLTYAAPLNFAPGTVDLTGGYSYANSYAEYPWYEGSNLSTDVLGGNGPTPAEIVQSVQDIQESRLISFFGRANYNLNDRWLAGFSLRRDGSSRFGPGNQWATFPAVSVGWRISEEPFMPRFWGLSDLKLRAAWGKTGNQEFANYQQYARYQVGDAQTQALFGTEYIPTIRPSAFNPNIKWEPTASWDLGFDFNLLGQRLSGSFDWYTKNTDDLIFNVPVCAGCNLSNFATINIGSMKNRGIELMLSARVRQPTARGLSWTADVTASHNVNQLVTINPFASAGADRILTGLVAGGVGTYIQVLQPGQPINSFYVYEHRRGADGRPVYATGPGADTLMYVDRPTLLDTIADANGSCPTAPGCVGLYRPDGTINQDDRRPFHDPTPKWILGHSSYFGYRNFDLSFTLRAYLGNYV